MNTPQNKRNERVQLLLMEVSAHQSKLLTSLHKVHPLTKHTTEDVAMVEEMMGSLERVAELHQQLKKKYPIQKVIFK